MKIERRRRWIELIQKTLSGYEYEMGAPPVADPMLAPRVVRLYERRKRLLSLLRRVRRCPECIGAGRIGCHVNKNGAVAYQAGCGEWICETCGGTGRL